MHQLINGLIDLAKQRRTIRLAYRKPGESRETERLVEPYRFQSQDDNLMLQSWQLEPNIAERTKWRNFRLDRIRGFRDGGTTFSPRCDITMTTGEVHAFDWSDPPESRGPVYEYRRFVERAMMDGKLDSLEVRQALCLHKTITPSQIRAVHAQVFRDALEEQLQDGEISKLEEEFLAGVHRFLSKLGYAPGEAR